MLDNLTLMERYKSKLDKEIELTNERLKHILDYHPEIEEHVGKFKEVLLNPSEIRISSSDKSVLLFHKAFDSIEAGRYLRVTVKINERWFILTAYLTKRLVGRKYEQ